MLDIALSPDCNFYSDPTLNVPVVLGTESMSSIEGHQLILSEPFGPFAHGPKMEH